MVGLQPEFCPDGPPPLKSPAVYFFIFRSLSLSLKHITVAGLLFPFPVQLGFKIPWDFFFLEWGGGGLFGFPVEVFIEFPHSRVQECKFGHRSFTITYALLL